MKHLIAFLFSVVLSIQVSDELYNMIVVESLRNSETKEVYIVNMLQQALEPKIREDRRRRAEEIKQRLDELSESRRMAILRELGLE